MFSDSLKASEHTIFHTRYILYCLCLACYILTYTLSPLLSQQVMYSCKPKLSDYFHGALINKVWQSSLFLAQEQASKFLRTHMCEFVFKLIW